MGTKNNNCHSGLDSRISHTRMDRRMGWFTLVELIVVITILVILWTLAAINVGGFSGSARDSARVSDLTNMSKGLDMLLVKNGRIPAPDPSQNIITLTASGTPIGYQWYAWGSVLSVIKMSDAHDPLDKKFYTYRTNTDYTKYQLLALFEDSNTTIALQNAIPWIDQAHAGYETRFPMTKGSKLGVLLYNSGTMLNQPIQELYDAVSFTGVDVVNTNTWYVAILSNKSSDRLSGTGIMIANVANMLGNAFSSPFTKTMGGSGLTNAQGFFIDADGYIYVTGRYDNTTTDTNVKDFNGNTLPGMPSAIVVWGDGYVAKLNSFGKQIWIKTIGGSRNDPVASVSVDANGNVYVGGSYANDTTNTNGVRDFSGSTLPGTSSASTTIDSFVAKLSGTDGSQMWIKTMGWVGNDNVNKVYGDTMGNVFVTGPYNNNSANVNGVRDFAGNTLPWISWTVNSNGYVAELSGTDGSQIWVKTIGWDGSWARAGSIYGDSNGNIYVASSYYNNLSNTNQTKDFAGNTLSGVSSDLTLSDSYVAKLSWSDGSQAWIKTMWGSWNDYSTNIYIDATSNLYIVGNCPNDSADISASKDFAGNTLLGKSGWGTYGFIAKLSNDNGSQMWIKTLGGHMYTDASNVTRYAYATNVYADANNGVYVSGYYWNDTANSSDTKDFAERPLLWVTGTFSYDNYLAKLSANDGSQSWIKTMGGTGDDYGTSIYGDTNNNLYVAWSVVSNSGNTNAVKDFAGSVLPGLSGTLIGTAFLERLP